ncbi:MogA/MoaB family molybdenum cofactor biosynthesis protein [Corynebacterium sphenisci]|uniref:MogA/MoaB family molybdenum cofactor biosynthesis protein n=1 Tax=Corynebacterium sphenisci TaxID=191493 RepID=UPI0026E0339F|nr:molybdopterin-binding protein [Corynebacterium sphenisci]MDO5730348.1 molybdopterin-binding protein [Corynebacterium sphenisci]
MTESEFTMNRRPTRLPEPVPGAVIVVDDRVAAGRRPDRSGELARTALAEAGVRCGAPRIVAEEAPAFAAALAEAVSGGARLVLTAGGTGCTPRDIVPEVTREQLALELPGLATQILVRGLSGTPLAGLSRGVVGLTGRGPGAALVVNAPGSRGGVRDAVAVIAEVLPNLLEQLDEDPD